MGEGPYEVGPVPTVLNTLIVLPDNKVLENIKLNSEVTKGDDVLVIRVVQKDAV